jgi:hypothetical protein
MGILESWYSDLRAILPVIWEKKSEEYTSVIRWGGKTVQDLMVDADARLLYAMNMYRPTFEGEDSCDPLEKEFMIYLRGILYLLDEITAISKIIDKVSSYEDGEELVGG